MAGRPKRDIAVKGVYLRLPPALLARVEHCHWLLQRQHGPKVTQTTAFWRLLEAGCTALEATLEARATPAAPAQSMISEISDISPMTISKISDIAGDDVSVPGYGFPEDLDEDMPVRSTASPAVVEPAPAPPMPMPPASALPSLASAPRGETPTPRSPRGLAPEKLQEIADTAAQYDKLSLTQLSQLLFDRHIYRTRDRQTGAEHPVNKGTLQRLLKQARDAGAL